MKQIFIFCCLAFAACSSNHSVAPDLGTTPMPICKTPPIAPPSGSWFTEITSDVGLGTADAPVVQATSVRAADLDGDGFPDVLATVGNLADRQTPAKREVFLLMNRPDPNDASKRIFVDTTQDSGILATRDGAGGRAFSIANFGDLDDDGDLDVVVCPAVDTSLDACGALLNDGTAHFTLAPFSALDGDGAFEAASAALLDFDRDGHLDFWPATFSYVPALYRGAGDGTFTNVAAQMGLPTVDGDPAMSKSFRQTFGVTACDLDGDGDLDVVLADYGREANQVWRNDGATFTEIGQQLGVAWDNLMDYTKDDESYLCWCQANAGMCDPSTPTPVAGICPDRGWVPGQSDQPWRLGGNNFTIACGDLDDDGDLDLMTATIRHWDVGVDSDPSEILLNVTPPGQPLQPFTRPGNMATGIYRAETGGWNEGDQGVTFVDVDLDGLKDIYLESSDYPGDHAWLWHQKPDHSFEDLTAASGVGQKETLGISFVDLDGDGDLDLIAGTSSARGAAPNQALRVYRNDIGQYQNWVRLKLVGAGAGHSNTAAIGARVKVTAGGHTQLQEVSGGGGHGSIQNDVVLTFGLGATCTVDSIEVRWPDGAATTQTFTGVLPNYTVEIDEGQAAVKYLQ